MTFPLILSLLSSCMIWGWYPLGSSFRPLSFFSSVDVTLPKAPSVNFCSFHFAFLLSSIFGFGHHLKLISLALQVKTSRGTCELHLCVLVRCCGAISCDLKLFQRGLTSGRTDVLFSPPCSWCWHRHKIQDKNQKSSRGYWMGLVPKEEDEYPFFLFLFFFSGLYWN